MTTAYNARDDFTTFRAHEWTTTNGTNPFFTAAHQIVIYRDDFGEVFVVDVNDPDSRDYPTLIDSLEAQQDELAQQGKNAEFMVIPHPMDSRF